MKSGPGSKGTSTKKAQSVSSNKRISAGSKSSTSAKTVKATVTPGMQKKKDALARANRNADTRDKVKALMGANTKKGVMKPAIGTLSHTVRKFAKGGNI